MTEWIKERPWIWLVAVLVLFVSANVAMFTLAQATHGPDLLEKR